MTTLLFDVEKERQDTQQSTQSVTTNSVSAIEPESDYQKVDIPERVATKEANPDDDEYPQGLRLFCIVVALGMSIFLVALDMVRLALHDEGPAL